MFLLIVHSWYNWALQLPFLQLIDIRCRVVCHVSWVEGVHRPIITFLISCGCMNCLRTFCSMWACLGLKDGAQFHCVKVVYHATQTFTLHFFLLLHYCTLSWNSHIVYHASACDNNKGRHTSMLPFFDIRAWVLVIVPCLPPWYPQQLWNPLVMTS